MSYSNKIKSDFKTLAREAFEKALSHCKTPQEIDSFCDALHLALHKGIIHEQVKYFLNENSEHFGNLPHDIETMLSSLLELASNEGFELYATEGIIDLVNEERNGTSFTAPSIQIPAFTSDKNLRNEKIEEAKTEFTAILREEFYLQLAKAFSLSDEQKLEKIQEQQKSSLHVSVTQAEMASKQPPQEGAEAHVQSEDEWLSRQQSEFQHVGNRAHSSRNAYAHMSQEDLLGDPEYLQLRQNILHYIAVNTDQGRITNTINEDNTNREGLNNLTTPIINTQLRIDDESFIRNNQEFPSRDNRISTIQNLQNGRILRSLLENNNPISNERSQISITLNIESTNARNQRNYPLSQFFTPPGQLINHLNTQENENEVENTSSRRSSNSN